jgi:DNA polymerase III delta subunit
MELVTLIGDDSVALSAARETFLSGHGAPEHIDVALDGGGALLEAIRTPGVFGARVVAAEAIEALTKENVLSLKQAALSSSAFVVARAAGPLSPTLKAALSAVGEVRRIDVPKGAAAAGETSAEAKRLGLRLDGPSRDLLASAPIPRMREALELLAAAAITAPTLEEVNAALSSDRTDAAPWDLTDALDNGDRAKLFEVAGRVVPVVGVSFLVSHLNRLGRLVEAHVTDVTVAQELLGLKQRFQAERLVRTAKRLDLAHVLAALDIAADLSLEVRRTASGPVFCAGVLRIADAL